LNTIGDLLLKIVLNEFRREVTLSKSCGPIIKAYSWGKQGNFYETHINEFVAPAGN
jgi:hypothetical protein